MQTRKRDGQAEAMECKPLHSQHFTYLGTSIQFEHRQGLALCIHETDNPSWNPSLQKQNLHPQFRKVSLPILTNMMTTREENKKPRKVRMSLMGVSTDGDNNDNDREHVEKRRGRGAQGPWSWQCCVMFYSFILGSILLWCSWSGY